ncbi:hypothetical protein PRUB_b0244 [Pseudoalteromonas rubra]|uniref:Uncharacterized protein n=1 Tax=Pseudoalteromonas rubra TaxID=43658 RepID=A0A8T0BYI8_9GAMM|nr:hypothetical protein PRUB_b0244 [Pseudoalteromonas rubra]
MFAAAILRKAEVIKSAEVQFGKRLNGKKQPKYAGFLWQICAPSCD